MDKNAAQEIATLIQAACSACIESLKVVKEQEAIGPVKVYGRLVGEFLGHSYSNVLAPIWQAYPELEPQQMKEPYIEQEPELSEASRAAIQVFIEQVHAALLRSQQLLAAEQVETALPHGGLAGLADTAVDIQEFMNQPRWSDERAE